MDWASVKIKGSRSSIHQLLIGADQIMKKKGLMIHCMTKTSP